MLKSFIKTVKVGDLDIFYREAGSKNALTLLLLHGFPTSSQMFRNLIPALADTYHIIAPDYPGYGYSSMPPVVCKNSCGFSNQAIFMMQSAENRVSHNLQLVW